MAVVTHVLAALQEQPPPQQPAPNINISIDLTGLANLIWQSFLDHLGDVGAAVWQGIRDHIGEIGLAIWVPLQQTLQQSARAVWDGVWGSSANFVTQLPADLTYNFGPYRAIAADPLALAVGGATLALVLLGLRTLLGAMVGRDSVITHVTGRLIPAVLMTLAYPVLIVTGVGLLNSAATGLGQVPIGDALAAPNTSNPGLLIPFAVLWLLLIYYAIRLLIRLAYSLFRLLVTLVFGPVALILWAIPQTEWVTWFWLRELLAWATTPLLVTACLAMAIPLAGGRGGFLAAAAFGIAGLQAAYDLAGVLGLAHGRGGNLSPVGYIRTAVGAASGGGAGVAAASIPANRVTTLADMYGYQ
jgi:hypothetical protein